MPKAVGIIMDGNRRWAKGRGVSQMEGHKAGFEKLKEVARYAREGGIEELTVYAFSTENWNRSEEEVEYLMRLFNDALMHGLADIEKENGRIRFIGERERFSKELQEAMRAVEERTKNNTAGTLIIAVSYGGQAEILEAVSVLVHDGVAVTRENFEARMWSAGLCAPDLIIRTGGEQRLSNFLTWQSVYSELHFTQTLWPDFSKEELLDIITAYKARERRMGR